jgi:2-polyprenyl-3-methyl-5-hydroxy-6-metoxy-1,4-benzoquinol methylase
MITISVCPICSGQSFNDFLTCKDYTTTGETFNLKQCNFCDFVLTDPRPDESVIGKYYLSNKYISHTGGKKNLVDSIYIAARKIALSRKRKIIEQRSTQKTILDFGCGTGEFLTEMKNHSWEATGVEPSNSANAKAASLSGQKIYHSLNDLPSIKFDVITLWHVLEHLHDLNISLRSFSLLLKDSGTIFIAVPNLQSNDAKYYKSAWAAYDVPRHLWHFDKNAMKKLLANHGFNIVEILPMKMDAFYVSMLSESYLRPSQSKVATLSRALIRGLISNAQAKKKMNYSSLIYVAKK